MRSVKQVSGVGIYGEDLKDERRSSKASDSDGLDLRKSYTCPATGETTGEEVQDALEAIGGGSAEKPSFPLY